MAQITYIFGDLRTGQILVEIPLQGVTMSRVLNDDGDLRGTFHLDMTGHDNSDLVGATQPGKCYVITERDSIPIWGGIVWSRTYQSQAKGIQIFCRSFEAYPEKRIITSEYSRTQQDKRNMFVELWNIMQTDSSILVDLPAAFTSETNLTVDLEVLTGERKNYRQVLDSLANADPGFGFDWTIDINRIENIYTKTLRIGYPSIGAGISTDSLVFEYPGAILNYWQTESISSTGTHIETIGAGEGDAMIAIGPIVHNDLISAGWVRYEVVISRKDVTDGRILIDLGFQNWEQFKAPGNRITAQLKGDLDPIFGSYSIGDACKLVIMDPRHPVELNFETRIVQWTYTPPSDEATEEVNIDFEGFGEE